jgi:inhibitor of cysteine peptidase
LVLVSACGPSTEEPAAPEGDTADRESPDSSRSEVYLDREEDGSRVELSAGQVLAISLESNPTTGYRWEVAEADDGILRQVGEAEFQPQSDLIGAPGVEILRFEAAATGQTTLDLVYHRPWEKGVEPLETFSVEVTVR